jgi:hypothetical protein
LPSFARSHAAYSALPLQLGHQAANCKTGTIPWRIVFGDEAFIVRKPVFWTDVLAKREAKKVNMHLLREAAVAYAKEQCKMKGLDWEEIERVAEASSSIDANAQLLEQKQKIDEAEEKARRAADPRADIPEGWNVAFVCCWLISPPVSSLQSSLFFSCASAA